MGFQPGTISLIIGGRGKNVNALFPGAHATAFAGKGDDMTEKEGLTKGVHCVIIPKHLRVRSQYRGVEQLEARRAHNPEVVGSSPASATIKNTGFRKKPGVFLTF